MDAKDVVEGALNYSEHLAFGQNGDLWTKVYARLNQLGRGNITVTKVTSHTTTGEQQSSSQHESQESVS